MDYLVYLDSFPTPDAKVKVDKARVHGGGNIGNTLTAVQRLDVPCVLISKVGSDSMARDILGGFDKEGIDTSLVVTGADMASSFTYVMVTKGSRTCIHTPIEENITPNEILCAVTMLKETVVDEGGVALVHCDSRHTFAATVMARFANEQGIPVTLDCEKDREHFQDLLPLADIIFTNAHYPQLHMDLVTAGGTGTGTCTSQTEKPLVSASSAYRVDLDILGGAPPAPPAPPPPPPPAPSEPLEEQVHGPLFEADPATDTQLDQVLKGMEVLLGQGRARMVVTTLGDRGSLLMTRRVGEFEDAVDGEYWSALLDGLQVPPVKDHEYMVPFLQAVPVKTHVPDWAMALADEKGIDVIVCDAFPMSAGDVVDTTGAGDAFIGGFLCGICSHFSPTLCLKLGTFTAAEKLRGHGARQSLPTASALAGMKGNRGRKKSY